MTNPKQQTKRRQKMSKANKMAVDFQILDNGTAKAIASVVDAVGNAASLPATAGHPVWASDNPGLGVAEDTTDASGLTAIVTPQAVPPATTPALLTGAHVTITSTDTVDSTKVLTGTSDPIDVVASAATGFAVKEQ